MSKSTSHTNSPTPLNRTPSELAQALGEQLRALRLARDLPQASLAERAGVGLSAVKNLEGGLGSTVHSLVCVLRALGREAWLDTVAPQPTINPLKLTRQAEPRQRASRQRATRG